MAGSGDSGRMRSVRVECYVRGYHVYQRIWNPFVGEVVIAVREERNSHDRYAVAILEEDTCCSVGHLPLEISKGSLYFLKMGGAIKAEITGPHRQSDLPQGGLQIPCILILEHKEDSMIKEGETAFKKPRIFRTCNR